MSYDITEEEFLQAIKEALAKRDAPEGFYTTPQWCEIFGVRSEDTARRRIKQLIKLGRIQVGSVTFENMGGVAQTRIAYRFIP